MLTEIDRQVYNTMCGPSEFSATSIYLDYDCTSRLPELTVPTLFACGRFNEYTPEVMTWYQNLIAGVKIAYFEQSFHVPHLEETERDLQVVCEFLSRFE